jgi:cation diffusion facilitator CzcD-associated flavoprotein CzcO
VPKHPIGCKRMCLDTGYFETYNRPNVRLIDVTANPIEKFTLKGIQVGAEEIEFDSVVFATGYDAMTGSLTVLDITGRNGLSLRDEWKREGPRTYLGLGVSGFPNMFVIAGPGSPSVLSNMVLQIEQHVEWIGDCMDYLRRNGLRSIDAIESYQSQWVDHVNAVANTTLYPTCNSWYVGANIPGKKRVFMPYLGFPTYEKKCKEVAAKGYEGFRLSA